MDKHRDITKSVPPREAPAVVAVRWLGCYGRLTHESVNFEYRASRVSCEVMQRERITKLHMRSDRVGLLIDTNKTKLIRAWAGDAYTPYPHQHKPRTLSMRDVRTSYVRTWDRVYALRSKKSCIEALISNPVYSAVVLDDSAQDWVQEIAITLAWRLAIPVIHFDKLDLHEEAAPHPRCNECHVRCAIYECAQCGHTDRFVAHRRWCGSLWKCVEDAQCYCNRFNVSIPPAWRKIV